MTIGEAAQATGLTKKAIRYYEEVGLIVPRVLPNGYHEYADDTLKVLETVAILRRMGFSVSEIRSHLGGDSSLTELAAQKSGEIAETRERLARDQSLLDLFLDGGLSLAELGRLHERLDGIGQDLPGYVGRRFRELFPGAMGNIYAGLYGELLSEPLQSDEQRRAWVAFVRELDDANSVEIPNWLESWAAQMNALAEQRAGAREKRREEFPRDYEVYERAVRRAAEGSEGAAAPPRRPTASRELGQTTVRATQYLQEHASQILDIVRRYLPLLSGTLQRANEFQERFQKENPEVVARLLDRAKERQRRRAVGKNPPAG